MQVSRFSMDEHVLRVHRTSADDITASEVQRTLDENKSVACPPCGKRLPLNELNHHIAKDHCDGNVDSLKVSRVHLIRFLFAFVTHGNPQCI